MPRKKQWKKRKSNGVVKQTFFHKGNYRIVLGTKGTTLLRKTIPFTKKSTYGIIKEYKGNQVNRLKKANLKKLFKKYGFDYSKKAKRRKK